MPSNSLPKSCSHANLMMSLASAFLIGLMVDTIRSKWLLHKKKSTKDEDDDDARDASADSGISSKLLSSRGIAGLKPALPYFGEFFKCLDDPFHPKDNPHGYIALCVAENKLVTNLLQQRLASTSSTSGSAIATMNAAFSDDGVYGYSSFQGYPSAREAVAYFIAKHFLLKGKDGTPSSNNATLTKTEALKHISPDQVGIGAGAASLLHNLFYCLGEKDDCCLIPSPYYAAFESDMNAVAGCIPFPVPMEIPENGPTIAELDRGYALAKAQGRNVRFLLLTNPHNPLGVIYDASLMKQLIEWSRSKGLHTIVDEIYALSIHDRSSTKFKSILQILDNKLGNDVHFLWAMSKDFGASGFRFGTLLSHNQKLMEAFGNLNVFSGVSHPLQAMMADLLTDDKFVDSFLEESRVLLRCSYSICTETLDFLSLPYTKAEAAIFVYVDFSSLLPQHDFEGERMLRELFFDCARIVLTPGHSQREERPGWFRICYAWQSADTLTVAMERLRRLVPLIKENKGVWSSDRAAVGKIVMD